MLGESGGDDECTAKWQACAIRSLHDGSSGLFSRLGWGFALHSFEAGSSRRQRLAKEGIGKDGDECGIRWKRGTNETGIFIAH